MHLCATFPNIEAKLTTSRCAEAIQFLVGTRGAGDTGVRAVLSGGKHAVQPGDELAHVDLA